MAGDKHPDILPRMPMDMYGVLVPAATIVQLMRPISTDVIVGKLAKHYSQHPGVIGWQTDNEFGCHSGSLLL